MIATAIATASEMGFAGVVGSSGSETATTRARAGGKAALELAPPLWEVAVGAFFFGAADVCLARLPMTLGARNNSLNSGGQNGYGAIGHAENGNDDWKQLTNNY